MTLPAWQQAQLDLLLSRLSEWRNADQEDTVVIGRSDIIAILDYVKDTAARIEDKNKALRMIVVDPDIGDCIARDALDKDAGK